MFYIIFGDYMNKKRISTILVFTFLAVVFASILISSNSDVEGTNEEAYYVEDNGNIFIKLAFICDDCAYYVVDLVLDGIERIFAMFTGN